VKRRPHFGGGGSDTCIEDFVGAETSMKMALIRIIEVSVNLYFISIFFPFLLLVLWTEFLEEGLFGAE
jgi:hypothetical protein